MTTTESNNKTTTAGRDRTRASRLVECGGGGCAVVNGNPNLRIARAFRPVAETITTNRTLSSLYTIVPRRPNILDEAEVSSCSGLS